MDGWNLLNFTTKVRTGVICHSDAEVGKLRPGGHMWPNELINLARRAFRVIPP